jgi:large subunit ribosomal protein L2
MDTGKGGERRVRQTEPGCYISLLEYSDGEKRYILAHGRDRGRCAEAASCEPKPGNCMPLASIPTNLGTQRVEMTAGQGGKLVRGAGSSARIMAKEGDWVTLVLPSGEMRMVRKECRATIGRLSNPDHQNISIGKAGRKRHYGWRPHVRGKAQNPVDHPHGGGEGRSNGGRHPCSPTGVLKAARRNRADQQ